MTVQPLIFKTLSKEIVFQTTSEKIVAYNGIGQLQFIGATSFIYLPFPYFGYKTIIKMNLHYSNVNGGYKIGDDGAAYDSRICEIPVWMMSATSQLLISNFLDDMANGRGENFTLHLPEDSGFFPFGADKGDAGDFVVSVVDYQKGGAIQQPYLQHENSLKLMLVSSPEYTPADPEEEGTMSIGSVGTYRPFQVMPRPSDFIDISRTVTRAGVVGSTDTGTSMNYYEANIDLEMREGNCAALIIQLLAARGGDTVIIPVANSWMFGIDNGSTNAVYACRLLSPEFTITHDNFNLWTTSLRFWMRAKS